MARRQSVTSKGRRRRKTKRTAAYDGHCGTHHKRRFTTQTSAYTAALVHARQGSPPLRVYRCPDCHAWHLTSRLI